MVLLRNPENNQKLVFADYDKTIQVHVASTPMREIQILYDNLMDIIAKHAKEKSPVLPSDILVMAPDIAAYESFIKAVFGGVESKLDFHIADLSMPSQSELVQGFLHLLSLPLSRWDAATLLQIFDYPAFQLRHHFLREDINEIRNWIKESAIWWGHDSQHRDELLKRDHCLQGMVEETAVGTWDYGMMRLLAGMMIYPFENRQGDVFALPSCSISSTQSELLGKLFQILRSLQEDLKPLLNGLALSLREWAEYLKCLFEAYYAVDSSDHSSLEQQKTLFAQIDAFQAIYPRFKGDKFSFETIRPHLESLLKSQSISYRENHLHAVRFCSMLPMRAIPAKVIALIGMQEGAFPRYSPHHSLDLVEEHPLADYCPSTVDFDRYLFLEALLSSRRYFIASYQGQSSFDAKEQSPSLLISELLAYLDKFYEIKGNNVSSLCICKHPLLFFDQTYFDRKSGLRSYSQRGYRAALAYYHQDKCPKHLFVPDFVWRPSLLNQDDIVLDLKQLTSLAQDPIKTYFNKTLGMYLDKVEDRKIKAEESFVLSHLEISSFRKISLKKPLDSMLSVAEKEGRLPLGPFKTVAIEKVRDEFETLKGNLAEAGVDFKKIFQVVFNERCRSPRQNAEGSWELPPLEIMSSDSRKIKIVGRFADVAEQGLIVHYKDDKIDVIKAWPQFLVLSALSKTYGLPIENRLIFAKSGKAKSSFFTDPFYHLQRYIDYYFKSLESPSPLIPEWIFSFLKSDAKSLEEKMQKDIRSSHFYNDSVKWMMTGSHLPDAQCLLEGWKGQAQILFEELYENGIPDAKRKGRG